MNKNIIECHHLPKMAENLEESPSVDDAAAAAATTPYASAAGGEGGGTAGKKRKKKPPSPRTASMKGVSGSENGE